MAGRRSSIGRAIPKIIAAGGSPLDFLINQILVMNPLSVLLWGAGLWYFFSKRGARYRVFGWAYLILFVLFIALQGKSYFLAPAYPPLFAGGAMLFGHGGCAGADGSRPMPWCWP